MKRLSPASALGPRRRALLAPGKHLGSLSIPRCRLQGAQTDPHSLVSAKPTFQEEIAATQSAVLLFLTCSLFSQGWTTSVSRRQTNQLLAAETFCFEKEHRKIVVRLGGAGNMSHSFPLFQEAQHLAGGVRRSKARALSLPSESFLCVGPPQWEWS